MAERLFLFFGSLRLTVVLLGLATILVFIGTVAQVEQGLYQAQARYFRSLFVFWSPSGAGWGLPVFPGGYLIGGLMLLNLTAATIQRLRFTRDHFGLFLVHGGLILLLLGQVISDLFSVESALRFRVGESRSYSEDFHANELGLTDVTEPDADTLVSIPERLLSAGGEVAVPGTAVTLRILRYWVNAELFRGATEGAEASGATQGIGSDLFVRGRPATRRMDERNFPAAVIEVRAGGEVKGAWLVSSLITAAQDFESEGRAWRMELRARRHYTPYSLTLIDCQHDIYPGTEIPKNFSSRVRVQNPVTGEDREVVIYMNNPLRYGGATYYQYQMAARTAEKSSTLQVVRNPGWLTPYVSCTLVGVGLTWQFLIHLVGFLRSRGNGT